MPESKAIRSISLKSTKRLLRRLWRACGILKKWESIPEKINPMGNAIALGHPLGATGAHPDPHVRVCSAPKGLRYGLVTMCIGGGQGIA